MFVKKTKQNNGRVYLAIVKNYRKDGKTVTKTVKSLGFLDELGVNRPTFSGDHFV